MPLYQWKVTWNYAYSPFKSQGYFESSLMRKNGLIPLFSWSSKLQPRRLLYTTGIRNSEDQLDDNVWTVISQKSFFLNKNNNLRWE